jgi:transglutaminase-like putative cysteine protease
MTMRLSVFHRTRYRYDRPARFVTQSHRLTPASFDGQRVVSWTVGAQGAAFGAGFTDGAGDLVNTMTHPGPVEAIEIRLDGIVETVDTAGVLRGHRETRGAPGLPAHHRGRPRRRARSTSCASGRWPARATRAPLDRAHRLAAAVAEAVVYRPGRTHARTTAAEALEQGEGVCQDQAHVLIALARAAGLPARYVTGYLVLGRRGQGQEPGRRGPEPGPEPEPEPEPERRRRGDGRGGRRRARRARGEPRLGGGARRGARLGRLRRREPLLPGRALHPARLGPRSAWPPSNERPAMTGPKGAAAR